MSPLGPPGEGAAVRQTVRGPIVARWLSAQPQLPASGLPAVRSERGGIRPPGVSRLRGGNFQRINEREHIHLRRQPGAGDLRFVLPDRDVREFDDLDEAIRFAAANAVYEVGVVFPDDDVRWIPLRRPKN